MPHKELSVTEGYVLGSASVESSLVLAERTAEVLAGDCCVVCSGNGVCEVEVVIGAGGVCEVGRSGGGGEGVSAVWVGPVDNSFDIVSVSIAINSATG